MLNKIQQKVYKKMPASSFEKYLVAVIAFYFVFNVIEWIVR